MATSKNVTLRKGEGRTQLKPYCVEATKAAEQKRIVDQLRPVAAKYLREKLDADPETQTFTGTVVYIFRNQMYKIRVQRPRSCNWLEQNIDDPNLTELKQVVAEIDTKENRRKELEAQLAKDHPECVQIDFTIALLR